MLVTGPSELLNELKKRGYNVRWLSKEMNSNGVNSSTSLLGYTSEVSLFCMLSWKQ